VTQTFDLSAIVAALPEDDRYRTFRRLVTVLASIETTICDLQDAHSAVEVAQAMLAAGGFNQPAEAMKLEALMVYAVICYCRALHSGPIDRQRVGPGKRPHHLRTAHDQIVVLRDQVFAHYGHGERHEDGRWRDEPFVMRAKENSVSFGYASSRAAFREQVIVDLDALIAAAIPQLRATSVVKQGELAAEVERLGDDAEFVRIARSKRFDAIQFFRGREVGESPSLEYLVGRGVVRSPDTTQKPTESE